MPTERNGDWRYWVGTALMASAVVFFVSAWLDPPDTGSDLLRSIYYGSGIFSLGVGWWLRTRSDTT